MVAARRIAPSAGQESVWDYPRPPRVETTEELVEVVLGGTTIASSGTALRVLETSHPPTYYLPKADFVTGALQPVGGSTYCEFKGVAAYFDLVGGGAVAPRAGWTYPSPTRGFEQLLDYIAVMPGLMDECRVAGERVRAQAGGFYGGWITDRVVGPFKGEPGTLGW